MSAKLSRAARSKQGSWRDRYGGLTGWFKAWQLERADQAGRLAVSLGPDWPSVQRLVFVCTGNLYRSPLACALARAEGMKAASFGIHAATNKVVPADALAAADLRGVDLRAHRSVAWLDFQAAPGDLLVVMEGWHHRVLTQRAFKPHQVTFLGHWAQPRRLHVPDPVRRGPACLSLSFAQVASGVEGLVSAWKAQNQAAHRYS